MKKLNENSITSNTEECFKTLSEYSRNDIFDIKGEYLKISDLEDLVGKVIAWHAPSSRYNADYFGIAKITFVDLINRNPIISESLLSECDKIDHAFFPKDNIEDCLYYSDLDRRITFKVLDI